jgi:arginase family enzyme
VGGGLSAAQMRDLFNFMEQNCEVDGMGIAEICPDKDIDQKSKRLVAEGVTKVLGLNKWRR